MENNEFLPDNVEGKEIFSPAEIQKNLEATRGDIVKAYKYRAYPDKKTLDKFKFWEKKCRFLYNFFIEHWHSTSKDYIPHPRVLSGERRDYLGIMKAKYPELFSQKISFKIQDSLITLLKKEFPEIELCFVPSKFLSRMATQVDQAYGAYFSNLKKYPEEPNFKNKNDDLSLTCNNGFQLKINIKGTGNRVKIMGIPGLKEGVLIRYHKKIEGRPTTVTVKKEKNKWYVIVSCIVQRQPMPLNKISKVGIDVGIKRNFQLSNGNFYHLPIDQIKVLENKKAYLQWKLRRKQKGNKKENIKSSKNFRKAYRKISKLDSKIANIRDYHLKIFATDIAKNFDVIHVEDLKVKNLTKSAAGTIENPGKNVAQKRGLNRAMLRVAPSKFVELLSNKAIEYHGIVVKVDPRHTSQTCSKCKGDPNRKNRKSQSEFECITCGFKLNADHNAAINILDKEPLEIKKKPKKHSRSKNEINKKKKERKKILEAEKAKANLESLTLSSDNTHENAI